MDLLALCLAYFVLTGTGVVNALLKLGSRVLTLSEDSWFYIFPQGFLFATNGLVSSSVRLTASVLLSLSGEPFTVETKTDRQVGNAFLVRPGLWRRVHAPHTPMVSFGLTPTHEYFRSFSVCNRRDDVWPIAASTFAGTEAELHKARAGDLSPIDALAVSRVIGEKACALLPDPPALDPRIAHVMSLVEASPNTSMMQLAAEVDLSYFRLSHLFSRQMGITLRMYSISCKLDAAAVLAGQGLNLTQIAVGSGFSDAAHFCRTWIRSVGGPPSQLLSSRRVGIRSAYPLQARID